MTYEQRLASDGVSFERINDFTNKTMHLNFYRRMAKFQRGWDRKERMVTVYVLYVFRDSASESVSVSVSVSDTYTRVRVRVYDCASPAIGCA
jgi:hypothetical protein